MQVYQIERPAAQTMFSRHCCCQVRMSSAFMFLFMGVGLRRVIADLSIASPPARLWPPVFTASHGAKQKKNSAL